MKYYLNGFPKSGLHLLDALVRPLTLNKSAVWAGTYAHNSWTMQRISAEQVCNSICYMPDNWRLIGHCCYDEDIEWYMSLSAIAHIFIYRDLRDVAVSQAHHIMSDDSNLNHPEKELYKTLGSFDNVLQAVWNGIDRYPGILERWSAYEPWLERSNVLILRFEDVIADLEKAARRILDYAYGIRPSMPNDRTKMISDYISTNETAMIASARDTNESETFRKGTSGEWRQYKYIFREVVA